MKKKKITKRFSKTIQKSPQSSKRDILIFVQVKHKIKKKKKKKEEKVHHIQPPKFILEVCFKL